LRKEDVSFLSMYWQSLLAGLPCGIRLLLWTLLIGDVALYLLKCAPGATCREKNLVSFQ
jgi:hypothetical protein